MRFQKKNVHKFHRKVLPRIFFSISIKFLTFALKIVNFNQIGFDILTETFCYEKRESVFLMLKQFLYLNMKDLEILFMLCYADNSKYLSVDSGIFCLLRQFSKFAEIFSIYTSFDDKNTKINNLNDTRVFRINNLQHGKQSNSKINLISTTKNDFKKKKNALISQEIFELSNSLQKDIVKLNAKLESDIIKQIYYIEQIHDDSRSNSFTLSKIGKKIKQKIIPNPFLTTKIFFVVACLFLCHFLRQYKY